MPISLETTRGEACWVRITIPSNPELGMDLSFVFGYDQEGSEMQGKICAIDEDRQIFIIDPNTKQTRQYDRYYLAISYKDSRLFGDRRLAENLSQFLFDNYTLLDIFEWLEKCGWN